MPFKSVCCCPRHEEWGHGVVKLKDIRVAIPAEEAFCKTGNWSTAGNKERKRKICLFCRKRVKLERKCEQLERELGTSQLEDGTEDDLSEDLSEGMDTVPCHNEPSCSEPEAPASPIAYKSTSSKTCQVPEETVQKVQYEALQERRKRDIRNEVFEKLSSLVSNYTASNAGSKVLLYDVIQSRKFRYEFGDFVQQCTSSDNDSRLLKSLAKDYQESKEKETTQLIKLQKGKVSDKILIGGSLKRSRLGIKDAPQAKSRTEIAKAIGRISKFGDERRRILSIVAWEFSQSELQRYFNCSKGTITSARVHAILFGKGGEPRDGLKFKKQSVNPEVISEFETFLMQDDVSRPSSCRSVLVGNVETGVRYWQSSVKDIIQQYMLKYPNGVKRTYIYTHLPKNFRSDSMLAGLCNLCDDFGHTNFEALQSLVEKLRNENVLENGPALAEDVRMYQKYLKLQYKKKQVETHSDVPELCRDFGFGTCPLDHQNVCVEFEKFYTALKSIQDAVANIEDEGKKDNLDKEFVQIGENHKEYMAHLIRTKHQGDYYRYVTTNLKPGEVVVIIDYKMKLEVGQRLRENQREWYGKRGISIHGFYVMAKVSDDEKKIEVIDLWSEDTKQDGWFTQSALDIGFKWLESTYPTFCVYLFSDNGPHYHNTGLLCYLAEVNSVFNFTLKEYTNFEAGEGKSALDSHFAHISHKVVRWVRLGNDLESGEQVGDLIKTMKNVTCRRLYIDRSKSDKVGTLKDISLFASFQFPTEGHHAGGIILRSLAGIGKTLKKTKDQVCKIARRSHPIAGATGAEVSDESPSREPVGINSAFPTNNESYAVRFIQHSNASEGQTSNKPISFPSTHHQELRPASGFALKHGPGKKTMFSQAQKDILVQFYDRQAINKIRAEPRDAMKAMEDAGLEVLSVKQIKSWWSTYHRKITNSLQSTDTNSVHRVPPDSSCPAEEVSQLSPPQEPVHIPLTQQTQQGYNTAPTTPSPVPYSTCSPQHAPSPVNYPEAIHQPSELPQAHQNSTGNVMLGVSSSVVTEWVFPYSFSQSTIGGRNGSNACALIALYMGKVVSTTTLPLPDGLSLDMMWKSGLEESMLKGNDIHDDVFDNDAVNLDVDEAIDVAGDICGVQGTGQQKDIFGNPKEILGEYLNELSQSKKKTCHMFHASGRAMLFTFDNSGRIYFIDSHLHKDKGALIAVSPPNTGKEFSNWLDNMMIDSWGCSLTLGSVTEVIYFII